MSYLLKRGKGALRRVVHLTGFDPRTGESTMIPLCGSRRLQYDTTSNVPWGLKVCKRCRSGEQGKRPSAKYLRRIDDEFHKDPEIANEVAERRRD